MQAVQAQEREQAKAAAKAWAKEKKKLEAKATKVERRIGTAISGMRKVIANEFILEVPASVTTPVQSYLDAFTAAQQKAIDIKNAEKPEWDSLLDTIPYKEAAQAEKVLVSILHQLKKSKELARR